MFDNQKFRTSTWRLDAVTLWGSAGFALFAGVVSLFEGKGMAVSMLLAAAALPLAFLTIVLLRHQKQIIAVTRQWFSNSGNEQTKKEEALKQEDQTEGEEHES